ncbi:MAG: SoxR reducing system RseC family protein [Eubacteriales bacterium]|nr:SoxR reducing system RseC family protein [Eubacteriales bacterium]MDD4475096.1 SoxR reducing system RseC family protein [Eubacteriales bacterium]
MDIKMTVKAYVLQIEDEEALVVARRKSACKACAAGCDGCTKSKELKAVVKNTAGAVKGDLVLVRYAKANTAALLVFILPIILGILIYFLSEKSARDYAAAISVVVMLAAFIALYAVVGRISYKFGKPEIEKILSSEQDYNSGEDD